MVMWFKRNKKNETWLHWLDSCLCSGYHPGPMWARIIRWGITKARVYYNRIDRLLVGRRKLGNLRDRDLVFAAFARCKGCGAGLAYPKNINMSGEWDCSAVLKGEYPPTKAHPTYPFSFYEIKSDCQPSAGGATTRPGVKRVIIGAIKDVYVPEE